MKIKRNTCKGATIKYVLWVEGSLGDMKQMTHLGLFLGGGGGCKTNTKKFLGGGGTK